MYDHMQAAAKHLAKSTTGNDVACSASYGLQYIQRWRALQGNYCNSSSVPTVPSPSTSPTVSSTVDCYAHPEADISACSTRNLVLSSSLDFLGEKDSGITGLPNPKAGSIQLACERTADPKSFLRGRLQSNEGSRMWMVQAPHFVLDPAASSIYHRMQQACTSDRRVQHPVLVITRVDPENAFHNLEGVISVFAALAVLQQEIPKQVFQQGLEVGIQHAGASIPSSSWVAWHTYPLATALG